MRLYFYTTPPDASVCLTLDTGQVIIGTPGRANGRDDAHTLSLPAGTPTQGGLLEVEAAGYTSFSGRGIVDTDGEDAAFLFDDCHLAALPPPPQPPPKPDPNQDPFAIITAVYEQGDFDLSTKAGCGEYTDAACKALFAQHSRGWGHIHKEPPQNMWEGHAVDAIMLLIDAGSSQAGGYDIIIDSESSNARPIWTYKGPGNPAEWDPPI